MVGENLASLRCFAVLIGIGEEQLGTSISEIELVIHLGAKFKDINLNAERQFYNIFNTNLTFKPI